MFEGLLVCMLNLVVTAWIRVVKSYFMSVCGRMTPVSFRIGKFAAASTIS